MPVRNYEETLQFLYEQLPMFQKQGASAIKKGLDNINSLCWAIGLPQWRFNSIHVAGTNGKGSTTSMIASVLMEAGYKTGTFTSPHLVSFTERIRINGKEISEKDVVNFVRKYEEIILDLQPSFFEITAAMAFDHFAAKEVDIAVIETGLGGRLDSTNIIRPEMSVITNISYDHMAYLGSTLPEIAGEKAGIIKKFTPVVIGEKNTETEAVFQRVAEEMEAPISFSEDIVALKYLGRKGWHQQYEAEYLPEEEEYTFKVDLLGDFQHQNVQTALASLITLREDGWDIPDKAIEKGMRNCSKKTGLRGRMEQISDTPNIWCDTGHNVAGVKAAQEFIRSLDYNNLHIVWGMVSDKDHDSVLSLLPKDAIFYFVKPDVPRGFDEEELQQIAFNHDLKGRTYASVAEGVKAAAEAIDPDSDLIFVGGSTFVVADYLESLKQTSTIF
jgi:dihydrofolate synthase/folylpolyglutamate synthase